MSPRIASSLPVPTASPKLPLLLSALTVMSSRPLPRMPHPEHHTISANGLRIHYVEVDGPGRPMLLLHGIGMDWRVWQAISRRLAPNFHLYMLDLRGHGQSDKPARGYSLAHYAADAEDFLDGLG